MFKNFVAKENCAEKTARHLRVRISCRAEAGPKDVRQMFRKGCRRKVPKKVVGRSVQGAKVSRGLRFGPSEILLSRRVFQMRVPRESRT
jgi:hypothetical protein